MNVIIGLILLISIQFAFWVYFDMQSQSETAAIMLVLCVVSAVVLVMQFRLLRHNQAIKSQFIDKVNKLNLLLERRNFSLKVSDERVSNHKLEQSALIQENKDMLHHMHSKVTWITQQAKNDQSFMMSHLQFLERLIIDKQFLRNIILQKQHLEFVQIDLIALLMKQTEQRKELVRTVEFDEEQVLMVSDSKLLEALILRLLDLFSLFCQQLDCHLICYTDNDLGDCVRLRFNLLNCNKDCRKLIKQSSGKIHQKIDDKHEVGLGYQFAVIEQLLSFFNASYNILDNHIDSASTDFDISLPLKTQTKSIKNAS